MNTELFIARRIIGKRMGRKSFSSSIVAIATFGIALGLTVMIVAVAIITGFKRDISSKVTGFGAHIQILNLDSNLSYDHQYSLRFSPFQAKTGTPDLAIIAAA